ncbi:MAG: ubiquitin carboxyl-terminal hydrolase [Parachlamydia sp.]|nr:ubiquitin carboxyl-terminal hydrolase [Parachlamydia sp.]
MHVNYFFNVAEKHVHLPLFEVDPYQDRPSFKLKEAQEVFHEGRKYRILIYDKHNSFACRFLQGVQALLATVFTLFIGLALERVQKLWSQTFSEKEIKIIKLIDRTPEAKAFERAHPPQIRQVVEAYEAKEAVKPTAGLPRVKAPEARETVKLADEIPKKKPEAKETVKLADDIAREKALESAEVVKPAPINIPLAATGGFANAGLSCYIGATLQCVKNIPAFWTLLKDETHLLSQKENESSEKFQLRLQIRKMILQVLTSSKAGKTVGSQDMSDLWNLLSQYDSVSIPPRQAGDPRNFWTVLCSILQIPKITNSLSPFGNYLVERDSQFFTDLQKRTLDVVPLILPVTPYGIQKLAIEPTSEIQLRCGGQLVRYRLAGFVHAAPMHAIAYVKEADSSSWVQFNDSRVCRLTEIPAEVKQSISLFLFEKVRDPVMILQLG